MSSSHLAAKYRPSKFSEVAGQEAVKAILSRASAEDRIAPAYLFSGTRGVGKTTIARIMAKALNCETAPTPEPCGVCRFCRQIAKGAAVDVVEIDAASNRGIDEARRLKEEVGYAPMECRYKVFIIDEAHMLTTPAFNALLKTLEEPPPRVTFILATTESHKFPATIISRCQHYAFKRLPQAELEAHLNKILDLESMAREPAAVSLIARRGAGSVRDSMSLLGMALALGGETLTAAGVRSVLGLAGPEVLQTLFDALAARDLVAIDGVLNGLLDEGLDLGFFLGELAQCWRNLFLLKQAGEAALPLLALPEEEARAWLARAPEFTLAHVHACWQMTLDARKNVLRSLEPAMALELLLLNLAFLPDLMDLESGVAPATKSPALQPGAAQPRAFSPPPRVQAESLSPPRSAPSAPLAPPAPPAQGEPRDWQGFLRYFERISKAAGRNINGVRMANGEIDGEALVVHCQNETHCEQNFTGDNLAFFETAMRDFFGPHFQLEVRAAAKLTHRELRDKVAADPAVQEVLAALGGRIVEVEPEKK